MLSKSWSALAIDLADEGATARLAARLAAVARPGDVIALRGELGSGKTAFARAFIRAALRTDEVVPSPTFTLVQVYGAGDCTIWHFDLYRLAAADDAWELGIEEAFAEAISLIEWPERLGSLLPARRLDLTLTQGAAADARRAALHGAEDWAARLAGIAGDG